MDRSIRDIEILGPMGSEYAKGIGCDVDSQVLAWRDAYCIAMQWFFVSVATSVMINTLSPGTYSVLKET